MTVAADELLLSAAEVEIQATGKSPTVSIVAYTGGLMVVPGWGPVAIELGGIDASAEHVSILADHNASLAGIVGHGKAVVANGKLLVQGSITPSTDAARQVVDLAKGGFRSQASVGVAPLEYECVRAGELIEVNGRAVKAPALLAPDGPAATGGSNRAEPGNATRRDRSDRRLLGQSRFTQQHQGARPARPAGGTGWSLPPRHRRGHAPEQVRRNQGGLPRDGLAYRIKEGRVLWETDPVRMHADDAFAAEMRAANGSGGRGTERRVASDWLRSELADGPRTASEVIEAGEQYGYSERTLRRAYQQIGQKAKKESFDGPWMWRLADPSGHEDTLPL